MFAIFHISRRRLLALGLLASASLALVLPRPAAAYGWPLKPFDQQHPVRGFFGDPRIAHDSQSFHFGVDISGPNGTPVFATLSGRISIHPLHRDTVLITDGRGNEFSYWHLNPTVQSGQVAVAYRTIVGTIAAPWAHVHFSERRNGRYLNPLRRGALAPYGDDTRPSVRFLTAERLGMPLGKRGLAGHVDLVAEVLDETPVSVPAPWTGKPVAPALLRWRLLNRRGRALMPWATALDVREALPSASFEAVYARWTRQNHAASRGRYRIFLTHHWDTRSVADGPYRIQILAGDTGGNRHTFAEVVIVRNHTPLPLGDHEEEDEEEEEGNASRGLSQSASDARAVVAAFRRQGYRPGQSAELVLWSRHERVSIDILRCGPEPGGTRGNETMKGVPVAPSIRVSQPRRSISLKLGRWPSGLYVARLTAPGGRVGFAPFVLAPARLGENRVAVVLPTNTWQAYNFRDGDGDGHPDSWYQNRSSRTVSVARPYLDRGVPPHFRHYDLGFLRWLHRSGKVADVLAQEDVERVSGARLARLYDLIIFPGHHEYVTEREYDAIQRYRDLGGHLAFLSANNFFWRVDRHGDQLRLIGLWRELGRPEAALVGVQYFQWNAGRHPHRPYLVTGLRHAPWLFKGTGAVAGGPFGAAGIEVDGRTARSPRGIRVLAVIPNALGTDRPAEMTYYETRQGAKVFAAGAFTLGGAAMWPQVSRLLENLWARLAGFPN